MRLAVLFFIVSGVLIAGCQHTKEGTFAIDQISISDEGLTNGQNYYVVAPLQWDGPARAELTNIGIVNEAGEPINASEGIEASFYVGADTKQTGVFRREEIGEKQQVEGYELTEEQTLIMQVKVTNTTEGENRKLSLTYSSGGEEYEKLLEWEPISDLNSSAMMNSLPPST
ncbi:hypothetical protein [Salimicrobium flavidum]|uniref:Uncharacterized protein n=1 Tax=Salimicrobium flavidum TaxID=570947 RepID=A0A1N7J7Y7_9BACI|nr:hypothetical protein [Salimicrobium flavidum]SIS45419.1 hypothetical protein SAMN05421687_104104 [Salimicrobium flavidum]